MSIKYALERDNFSSLREEVLANTYVDNVLIGADTTEECIRKQRECKQIFHRMGMNLREFMSNNSDVMSQIPEHDRMNTTSATVKLLGLKWNPNRDTLHIRASLASHLVTTKRTALRAIASNFDPLGYLSPLFVQAKIFIQDLWKDEYDWDTPLTEMHLAKWQEIVHSVEGYVCSLPRVVVCRDEEAVHELLLFADASKRMYSAVAYLLSRTPGSSSSCHLLMAKTRLAPIKETTIPRLELMACDTAVSLAQFLLKELTVNIKVVRFFSDSHIVLYWLHTDRPAKAFVDNRVKRIRCVTDDFTSKNIEVQFYYVSSESNPADCATRGLSSREISGHFWWTGPEYVSRCPTTWPHSAMNFTTFPGSTPETEAEFKVSSLSTVQDHRSVLPFQRTNNFNKLLHCTVFLLKFLKKRIYDRVSLQNQARLDSALFLVGVTSVPKIESRDVEMAEFLLFRDYQRESATQSRLRPTKTKKTYKDPNGIIRVVNRMKHAEMTSTAKNPILLAPDHALTKMIIRQSHLVLSHAGVEHLVSVLRQRYFIPSIRTLVRSIIRQCVPCQRQQACPYKYPNPPDLPFERVTRSRPFQRIDLDYFGPLQASIQSMEARKVWVCLFTCMTTRALHLELVHDNSSSEFLFAFRRFMARRGVPDHVISDNAPTFKLGKDILTNDLLEFEHDSAVQQFATQNVLRWKFITPFSPWKGGFYERLIGIVKRALKKTIHRNTLNIRSLETLLIEIEAALNTRPLTTVTVPATGELTTLRPIDLINPYYYQGHFLSPLGPSFSDFQYYVPSDSETKQSLKAQHECLLSTLDHFWSLWKKDYLQVLAERTQSVAKGARGSRSWPTLGEVVLIAQDNVPRTLWPLAIITRLNKSQDGVLRSVQVKTGKNTYPDRSINQLIPLELHVPTAEESTDNIHQRKHRTRSVSPSLPTRTQPP
uniref:Integrase catalytic domain-containing protein n=1 Tax=Haemonchus contortus TaxID=6289 RepID=A0A7I4XXG8_HAECO